MIDKQDNIKNIESTIKGNTNGTVTPGAPTNAVPDAPANAVPGTPTNAVPDAQANTVPDAPANAVPGVPANAIPGTPTNAVPDAPANAVPGVPANAVPGVPANVPPSTPKTKEQIWTTEDLCMQIRSLENQLFLIEKTNTEEVENKTKDLQESIIKSIENFEKDNFSLVEQNIIDTKVKIYQIINKMTLLKRMQFFISLWAITPITIAIIAEIIAFYLIISRGSFVILGVPLWASLIAVAGTSVQILIGVANDYKDDSMVTDYKRLWYIVLPFISFVFGFIAYLLTTAGFISITLGQISSNQSANLSTLSGLSSNLTGGSSVSPSAILIIICFLSGYATNWFMELLLKYTPDK
jgi:hypothetical protein